MWCPIFWTCDTLVVLCPILHALSATFGHNNQHADKKSVRSPLVVCAVRHGSWFFVHSYVGELPRREMLIKSMHLQLCPMIDFASLGWSPPTVESWDHRRVPTIAVRGGGLFSILRVGPSCSGVKAVVNAFPGSCGKT